MKHRPFRKRKLTKDELLSRLWELICILDTAGYKPDDSTGFFSSEPAEETRLLLWMADIARERLYGIATKSPLVANKFAKHRVNWPAVVSLSGRIEGKYQELIGEFNKAGTNTKAGKLLLGAELPFQVNRKTKPGALYQVSTWTIGVLHKGIDYRLGLVLSSVHPPLGRLRSNVTQSAREYLESLGEFCKDNWSSWKPIVEACLDFYWGPYQSRWELLTKRDRKDPRYAIDIGCLEQWCVASKLPERELMKIRIAVSKAKTYASVPLCNRTDIAEFNRAMGNAKSETARWTYLKKEILSKIQNLCPEF